MRDATNEALNKVVQDLLNIPGGADMKMSMDMSALIAHVGSIESDLHDCVNELCYQCGQYKTAHLGSCNGCRWLKVKEGFR
jgi:hypothetical protein